MLKSLLLRDFGFQERRHSLTKGFSTQSPDGTGVPTSPKHAMSMKKRKKRVYSPHHILQVQHGSITQIVFIAMGGMFFQEVFLNFSPKSETSIYQ